MVGGMDRSVGERYVESVGYKREVVMSGEVLVDEGDSGSGVDHGVDG
jgi:hypothetical protein